MKFIELSGRFINVAAIAYLRPSFEETLVQFIGAPSIYVKETPEQILKLIEEASRA